MLLKRLQGKLMRTERAVLLRALLLACSLATVAGTATAQDTSELLAAMRAALPPIPATIPSRDALPPERRRELPTISIEMLRWSDVPDQRLVIINGHRVDPDGVVGQELWLREIRQDGVVMQFRDLFFFQPR